MTSSLIISTYNNWPELELVLLSALRLRQLPTEILIADDGSGEETKIGIQNIKNRFSIPIHHLWHKDNGFRKATILNQAIAKAKGEYLIQLDGDCIMHSNFVADHIRNATIGNFLFGARVRIKEKYREKIFAQKKIQYHFFSSEIKKRPRSIYAPFLNLYKASAQIPAQFRGANCSFWKSDLIAVNGYNQEFKGWGREDSELIIRLLNHGILGRRLKFEAIVYHIDHNERSRSMLDANDAIQQNTIQKKLTWCAHGLDEHLS